MLDALVPPPPGCEFPEGGEVASLEAADGVRLRAVFFRPEQAKATVFVLQGRTEFLEKYGPVFRQLLDRNLAIAALDWRGQGGSDRLLKDPQKGHVEDFEDYLLDLEALMAAARQRGLPEPHGLLAHSTGGAIALMTLERGRHTFQRTILTSPLVGLARLPHRRLVRFASRLLCSIGLSGLYVPGGKPGSTFLRLFEGNPLTSDKKQFEACAAWIRANPEISLGDPTIGWVDAAFEAMATFEAPDFGSRNRTPILMLLAGADAVVDSEASAELARRMRGASAIRLPAARHEILIETEAVRHAFWAAFDAFMVPGLEETPVSRPLEIDG